MSVIKNTPPPMKRGFIYDKVKASDLLKLNFAFSCEDCSYFNVPKQDCALEHKTLIHKKKTQIKNHNISGKMALCRNLEID